MLEGALVKINSDTFTVKVNDKYYDCKSRGKIRNISKPLVGDKVLVNLGDLIIEDILPRKNALDRPQVANIDMALVVTSLHQPDINLTLLDKLLTIITINKIEPVIVLTKRDLASKGELKEINKLIKYYESIGLKVFNNDEISKLKRYLKGKIVTVCGQTGAGKSSLINKLDKNLNLKTDEISFSLNRGKHTTRIVELFTIDDFYIVDTPGFSQIDLDKYSKEDIKNSFKEFKDNDCYFSDCNHLNNTKGCKVISKVKDGTILKSRYDNYEIFMKEINR